MYRFDIEVELQRVAQNVDRALQQLLPQAEGIREDLLLEAMQYATIGSGKKVRAFLLLATAQLFDVPEHTAIQVAAAIEMIHSYSLIHDDLPCMDNSDLRRGKPSCHKRYGEATALLAGNALLSFAFEVLSSSETLQDSFIKAELVHVAARATGFQGMIGGQVLDLLAEKQQLDFAEIVRLQRMKTGELFAASCEMGSILGKSPAHFRQSLRAYAYQIGLAFQIADDLLDIEGDPQKLGKKVNQDGQVHKSTLVMCIGMDKAKQHLQMLTERAIEHLNIFSQQAEPLRQLASFIRLRQK